MADYRSDISPVEEYLLEKLEEDEGPEAANEAYNKLTGNKEGVHKALTLEERIEALEKAILELDQMLHPGKYWQGGPR